MRSLHGHILTAIDFETTGTVAGWHEIIQIAVVPLNSQFQSATRPFYHLVRPQYPERHDPAAIAINGISAKNLESAPTAETLSYMLDDWAEKLITHVGQKFVPLVHNWPFEYGFLTAWLGPEQRDHWFHYHARDAQASPYRLTTCCASPAASRSSPAFP